MRTHLISTALLLVGSIASAQIATELAPEPARRLVTAMTPETIREAITYGGNPLYPFPVVRSGGEPLIIGGFTTPFSRVAYAAKEAKTAYRPFSEKDITSDMIAPEIHVTALRQWTKYSDRWKHVVAIVVAPINSKDIARAIQPAHAQTYPDGGMVATFPLSVANEDNEVRIVYDGVVCGDQEECVFRFRLDKVR